MYPLEGWILYIHNPFLGFIKEMQSPSKNPDLDIFLRNAPKERIARKVVTGRNWEKFWNIA